MLTVGLVQVVKQAAGGELGAGDRLAPLVRLLCGWLLVAVVGVAFPKPPLGLGGVVLIGLGVGLAASGLYSQGRTLLGR